MENEKPAEAEIEIQSLSELDPRKLYHVTMPADASAESVQAFALAVKSLSLRALITREGTKFEAFQSMFENLPEEDKAKLLDLLQPKSLIIS